MSEVDFDLQIVASLVGQYFNWLTDNDGVPPDELLDLPLNRRQRRLLLEHMDNVVTLYGLTADKRQAGIAIKGHIDS